MYRLLFFITPIIFLASCDAENGNKVVKAKYDNGNIKIEYIYPDLSDTNKFVRLYYLEDGTLRDSGLAINKVQHGLWMHYDIEDGKIYRTEYVQGTEQGHARCYYPNGQLYYEGWNENGIADGEMLFYEEDGSFLEYNFYLPSYDKSVYRREYDSAGRYLGFKGTALFNYSLVDSIKLGSSFRVQFAIAEPEGCISSLESLLWNNTNQMEVVSDERDFEKRLLIYKFDAKHSGIDTLYVKWAVKNVETFQTDSGTIKIPLIVNK